MNKKAIIVIAAVMVLGASFLVWRNGTKQGDFASQIKTAETMLSSETANEVKVEITNFAYKSQILKVKKGTKVTWTNRDDAPHTVTSDDSNFLASERLNKGDTYEKTFTETGVYRYHCIPHPGMLGAVIVE